MIRPRQASHDLLHSVKRNESKTDYQLRWGLMNCPCPYLSRPEASPLLRDLRVDFLPTGNHPNVPGQAHVKFADGDEQEIPFPLQPQRNTAQISLGGIFFRKRSSRLFDVMNDHHFLRGAREKEELLRNCGQIE
jgi:hypothetical protein